MICFRILTCSTLAVAAMAGSIGYRSAFVSGTGSGNPGETAWALLAEAEEFCRSQLRTTPAAGSPARIAVTEEALEIALELAAAIGNGETRTSLIGAAKQLERRCSSPPRALAARLDRLHGSRGALGPLVSLDGSGRQERSALVSPYLVRLNDAVSEAVEQSSNRLASSTSTSVALPPPPVPGSVPESDSSVESEPEPQSIVIGSETRKHREHVARWSLIFKREAAVLREARRDLQSEIDSYSLARSRGACRAFDLVLARLDSEFERGSPSRGLSLRIGRMVAQYRRGVALCMAGRSAASFAYLSEGDREWALVAKTAARMFWPRAMRPV